MTAPVCFEDTGLALLRGWIALRRRSDGHPLLAIPLDWVKQKWPNGKANIEILKQTHREMYDTYAAMVDEDLEQQLTTAKEPLL